VERRRDVTQCGSGTGLVHIAPGHGLEDYDACRAAGMQAVACPVDKHGRFTAEADELAPAAAAALHAPLAGLSVTCPTLPYLALLPISFALRLILALIPTRPRRVPSIRPAAGYTPPLCIDARTLSRVHPPHPWPLHRPHHPLLPRPLPPLPQPLGQCPRPVRVRVRVRVGVRRQAKGANLTLTQSRRPPSPG